MSSTAANVKKRIKSYFEGSITAIVAPITAPGTVNISRYIPILTLERRSRTYADAEPLEVAIVDIMLAAIAYLIGIPIRVSTGMRMIPPPIPVIAPNIPAGNAIARRYRKFGSMLIA